MVILQFVRKIERQPLRFNYDSFVVGSRENRDQTIVSLNAGKPSIQPCIHLDFSRFMANPNTLRAHFCELGMRPNWDYLATITLTS